MPLTALSVFQKMLKSLPSSYKKLLIEQSLSYLEGNVSLERLKEKTEAIKDELLLSPYISQIDFKGIPEQEISIEVT